MSLRVPPISSSLVISYHLVYTQSRFGAVNLSSPHFTSTLTNSSCSNDSIMTVLDAIKFPFKTIAVTFSLIWFSIKLGYTITTLMPLISYMLWVNISTFAMVAAYEPLIVERIAEVYDHRYIRYVLGSAMVFVSEAPHYLAMYKIIFMYTARFWYVYTHWLGWFTMLLDIAGLGGCAFLYYENFMSIREMIIQSGSSKLTDERYSAPNMILPSLMPLYEPKDVVCYKSISYFGPDELRENTIKRLSLHEEGLLDIYTQRYPEGSKRPVLIYIHGGSWTMGSKDWPNTFIRIMAERGVIVVSINYRLAGKFFMPWGFIDIKLAIMWTKKNIFAYGGDPDFILCAGDSAGGHLAQLAAVTPNQAQFQERYKDKDTTIKGTILIHPILDPLDQFKLPRAERRPEWFRRVVCGNADPATVEQMAPLTHLTKSYVPPMLIFHGTSDNLVDVRQSIGFVKRSQELGHDATLIQMPKTQHSHMVFNSPRVIAQAHMASDWILDMWLKQRK